MNKDNSDFLTRFLENPPFDPHAIVGVFPYLFFAFITCAVIVRLLFLRSRGQKVGDKLLDFNEGNWGKLEGTIVAIFFVMAILSAVVMVGMHMAYNIPFVEKAQSNQSLNSAWPNRPCSDLSRCAASAG